MPCESHFHNITGEPNDIFQSCFSDAWIHTPQSSYIISRVPMVVVLPGKQISAG